MFAFQDILFLIEKVLFPNQDIPYYNLGYSDSNSEGIVSNSIITDSNPGYFAYISAYFVSNSVTKSNSGYFVPNSGYSAFLIQLVSKPIQDILFAILDVLFTIQDTLFTIHSVHFPIKILFPI